MKKTEPEYYPPVENLLDLIYEHYTENNPVEKNTVAGKAAKAKEKELEEWMRGLDGMDRLVDDYVGDKIPLWEKIMYRTGPVELASCSFGQSSKVSYLQMITAVAAIVNGGRLMQPYVVQTITDADGQVIRETEPTVKRQVISEETSAAMCTLMEGVVTDGTGKNGAVAGYRVGGKTGTSQKLDSEDSDARIASFVAVAPIDDPKIAVLVCLDEPHSWTTSGGALSGPVCAEVLEQALPYLGVEPSYTEEEMEKYFTAVPDVSGWRVTAARQKLAEYGLEAAVVGDGERVTSLYPEAGTSVRRESTITLDTTGSYDAAADA